MPCGSQLGPRSESAPRAVFSGPLSAAARV